MEYRAGIDIGSTTVKLVVLDAEDNIIYGQYRRHMAKTQETLAELLREAKEKAKNFAAREFGDVFGKKDSDQDKENQ